MERTMSKKSDYRVEISEMSSVEFVSCALRERVAPPSLGSVKARVRHAARRLGWSPSRTKDCWYADPRISISADEIKKIEQETGLHYGRQELRTNDDLIAKAEALLGDEDFISAFLAALRTLARPHHRT
jgi:hypothetical protein